MQYYGNKCDQKNTPRRTYKRVDHILRKYPELISSLYDIRNYEMSQTNGELKPKRVLRKDTQRARRLRRFRKLPNLRLRQFGSALYDAVDESRNLLLSCPICRNVLNAPITIHCGHTFCAPCLDQIKPEGKCFVCATDIGQSKCTNVLLQDLIDKWKESQRAKSDQEKNENALIETAEILGVEPRYYLRSRCAGLQPRNGYEEYNLNSIIGRFLEPSQEEENKHKNCTYNHTYNNYTEDEENRRNWESAKCTLNKVFEGVDCIREKALKASWNHITATDLECILCSRCLFDPITTSCGHTFCRECLTRVLDHGLACPLCMASLDSSDQMKGTTYVLEQALRVLAPKELEERYQANLQEIEMLDKSTHIPVFVCTNAFPRVACPLYVYEPRYRLLARRVLQSSTRTFAMAAKSHNSDKFVSYGTILEVKDAVHLHDGRSILTTIGIRRFKVISKGEQDGYDTAAVQYIRDISVSAEKLPELIALHQRVHSKAARWVRSLTPQVLAEVERLIGKMPKVEKNWPSLPDGPSWAWWLVPILPLSSQLQVGFLSTTSLEKRLRAIDKMLEHMKIRMKALERSTLNCNDTIDNGESCSFTERPIDLPFTNH